MIRIPQSQEPVLKNPVLLLGWIPRIVVPVARSLERHGVPVDVAGFHSAPDPHSRAIRDFRRLPHPDGDPAGFLEQLREFIRQGKHDMVIPTDDQMLLALTNHYHDLQDCAHIACPPPEITWQILDKSVTLRVAQQCGLRIPETVVISNSAQLLELAPRLSFPCVLKPARKELHIEEAKSLTLKSASEVAAHFSIEKEFAVPMLLQEYCHGHGVGIEILLHNGECVAIFQHRRLMEYPLTGGFSVSAVAEAPDPLLVQQSLSLLRALAWEGPAMVEFRVDEPGRQALLMEVNGRYWGTISLPMFTGVNFPLYHWQLMHAESPVVPKEYAIGTKWRWTAGHILRLHDLMIAARNSKMAREQLLLTLRRLSPREAMEQHDANFSPADPMPAIFDLVQAIRHLAICDFAAFIRRISATRPVTESRLVSRRVRSTSRSA